MTEQERKELQELKDAVIFLKKGYNDLASQNAKLKIDLISALEHFKNSGFNEIFKKVLDKEATYKEKTTIILNKTVMTQAKMIERINNLFARLQKIENK